MAAYFNSLLLDQASWLEHDKDSLIHESADEQTIRPPTHTCGVAVTRCSISVTKQDIAQSGAEEDGVPHTMKPSLQVPRVHRAALSAATREPVGRCAAAMATLSSGWPGAPERCSWWHLLSFSSEGTSRALGAETGCWEDSTHSAFIHSSFVFETYTEASSTGQKVMS